MVTVHEAARLMISISDNTAADHLVDLLGRRTVKATMAAYGHTSPHLNIPFMDTREFTALKVGPASGLRIQWIEGDEAVLLFARSEICWPPDSPVSCYPTPALASR